MSKFDKQLENIEKLMKKKKEKEQLKEALDKSYKEYFQNQKFIRYKIVDSNTYKPLSNNIFDIEDQAYDYANEKFSDKDWLVVRV